MCCCGRTKEEDQRLRDAIRELGEKHWHRIAERVGTRDRGQVVQRWNDVLRPGVVKGAFTPEEDAILFQLKTQNPDMPWGEVVKHVKGRNVKQVQTRWENALDPSVDRSELTEEEDERIIQAWREYGPDWKKIAECVPGRTRQAVRYHIRRYVRMLARVEKQEQNSGGEDSGGSSAASVESQPEST